MSEVIHESLKTAKAVCASYVKILQTTQELLCVWEANDDSCVATFVYTRYYDEAGQVKTYCHDPY